VPQNPLDPNNTSGYVNVIDQSNLTLAELSARVKPNVPLVWTDVRGMDFLGGILGGTVVAKQPEKYIPAVFAIQIVETVAGLSDIGYQPLTYQDGPKKGQVRSNSVASDADYKKILGSIKEQRTETVSYYVFYNPANGKDPCNPVRETAVLAAIEALDPKAKEKVKAVLEKLKLELKDKPFEYFWFPGYSPTPFTGAPKR
jgi:hypothetical protein